MFDNKKTYMVKMNSCGVKLFSKMPIYRNNQAAIILAKNSKSCKKFKHIDTISFYLRKI